MPGFQLERFVDLSEAEKTELQCLICREILKDPVFVECCLQTFCEECINQWLTKNSVCPYDRQVLTRSRLTRPPRLVINMLSKLKIRCSFESNGCSRVICLADLDSHLKSCPFSSQRCDKCNFEPTGGHNCIENLRKLNASLESELRDRAVKIESLETENHNYLQALRQVSENSNSSNILQVSENQMLIDARKHSNQTIVSSKSTPKEMSDEIVFIVSDQMNKSNKMTDICAKIRKRVETRFGGLWIVHSTYEGMATTSATIDNNFFVCIQIAKLKFTVHKVYDELNFAKISDRILQSEFDKKFLIYKTDMNYESIETVKKVILEGFGKYDNWTDFIENIFNVLPKRLGGVWNCIAYKKYLGHFCVIPKTHQFINFYIEDLELAIFQVLV